MPRAAAPLSRQAEDYLKAIHALELGGEAAGTNDIAGRLGIAAASVSGMLRRLARLGLDTRTVATRVRDRLQGAVATELHRGDQRLDLRVQLDASAVDAREELARLAPDPRR